MSSYMSPGRYLRFCIVATLTAAAGSQTVHMYYRPLADLEQLVEEELKKRKEIVYESSPEIPAKTK